MKSVQVASTSINSKYDLFYAMAPVTFVSRVLGIFPLVLKGPAGTRKYTRSLFYTIYSVTCTLGLLTTYIAMSLLPDRLSRISDNIITLAYFHATLCTTVLVRLTMLYYAVHAENQIANVISMIYAQDLVLRNLGTELDYVTERKNHRRRLALVFIVIMTFAGIDFGYQAVKNTRRVHAWFIWLLPNAMHHLSVCLFMSVALSAKKRFAAVNDNLAGTIRQTRFFGMFQTCSMIARQRDIARIRSLALIHSRLCDASHKLNEIYNVEIVTGIVVAFLTLLISLLAIFRAMKDTSDIKWSQVIGATNWGLMHVLTSIYVVVTCNMTTKEAHLTATLLYRMDPYEANGHLGTAVQLFSMQLMHHNLKFSGFGLFPLDSTLIQTIIGTATTYLVILIQFELAGM